jgi:hypothetical protein
MAASSTRTCEPSGLLLSEGSLLARERSGGGSGVLAVAQARAHC